MCRQFDSAPGHHRFKHLAQSSDWAFCFSSVDSPHHKTIIFFVVRFSFCTLWYAKMVSRLTPRGAPSSMCLRSWPLLTGRQIPCRARHRRLNLISPQNNTIKEVCGKIFRDTEPYAQGGVYVNFMTAEESDRLGAAYGPNFDRLVKTKTQYDPQNLFRHNQNIRPAA